MNKIVEEDRPLQKMATIFDADFFFAADDLSVALRFPIGAGSSSSDQSITESGMAELLVSKK